MIKLNRKGLSVAAGFIAAIAVGAFAWTRFGPPPLPPGIAAGNGRLEATEVDLTTKFAGRLAEVSVREGDPVAKAQALARMDVRELEAELRQAKAYVKQAERQRAAATAVIEQRQSEVMLAKKNLSRTRRLYENRNVSLEQLQQRETSVRTARAALAAAKAQEAHADAVIEAARARTETVRTRIEDSALVTPISGRVLYRLAEPGEVLASGGKVITVLDLSEVYMSIFLPTLQAGRLRIGDEARIVFDAAPQYRVPARVTFVSPQAQFTPKEVETTNEREKLMFRVRVRIDPALLAKHGDLIKPGVPGVTYVRLSRDSAWPEDLQVRLPQ